MHDQLSDVSAIEAMPVLAGISLEGIDGVTLFRKGKVRDVFELPGDQLVFVSADRVSAFDQVLGKIPGKGQVNNLVSAWWFRQMEDIIPNHMIALPDPNVMIGRKLNRLPVEVVVRGYMTGVTDTSIWGSYEAGEREIYGIQFRDGYQKNDKLDKPIITPTTKADVGHDERLTEQDILEGNVEAVTPKQWRTVREVALAMFARAQGIAAERGYILVDTKMEFGMDEKGNIYVIDELFTPDSSRFWRAESYEALHAAREEPENYDKEYLRMALKKLQKDGQWEPGKPIPQELRMETARRYISLYEGLTGETFQYPSGPLEQRITKNVGRWLEAKAQDEIEKMPWGVIIIMGSSSDEDHVKKITAELEKLSIPHRRRVGSVHKTLDHLVGVLGRYQLSQRQLVFITVAGGLDALSGTVDGFLPFPVISAPPEGQSDTLYAANLRTPEGIAPAYVIRPQNAALAAAKIFGLTQPNVQERISRYQEHMRNRVTIADEI